MDQELLADDERIVALVRRGTDEIHRDRNFLKSGMGDIKRHTMSNVDRLTRFIHTSDSNVASLKTGQQSILAGQQSILAGQELLSGQIHDLAILPEMINEVFVAESMERQKFAEVLAADSSERRMFRKQLFLALALTVAFVGALVLRELPVVIASVLIVTVGVVVYAA
ncbi:hypothetical protein F4821DRAFT_222126 [Hypoxylon rubiginosum]|uniref:Uncharacterized protein n=1 Tax=Hypoxylon rubiginosum TaxID=110542 RepID=A0ACC0DJS8_9PEZI|nr:hypothetical protein F4821DRAFT_222126 [Hypoxylon rubiginosum]